VQAYGPETAPQGQILKKKLTPRAEKSPEQTQQKAKHSQPYTKAS
jgi:hypothetical protein